MKRIAVIGCSFSRWIDPKDTYKGTARCWPHSLSLINKDIEVHNYSMYVNSCSMQYYTACNLIKHARKEFDAIILQWTTEHRCSFLLDKSLDQILKNIEPYGDLAPNYFHIAEEKNRWMEVNSEMLHISPGTLKAYSQKVINKNKFLSAGQTYVTSGVGAGGYYGARESVKALQFTLQEIAKKAGIPLYQMDWLDRRDSEISDYINAVDLTVETLFNFRKYVADTGYHFNGRGADSVASFINKWIQQNV